MGAKKSPPAGGPISSTDSKDSKKFTLGSISKEIKESYNFEAFPYEVYPESIQKLIEDSHTYMGYPKDITAAGILFAISVAMGNSIRLLTPLDYYAKPIVWIVIIAPRGSAKSHPINRAVKPINDYAGERYQEFEKQMDEYRLEGGKKPHYKNPITNNLTLEGMYDALNSNPKGIGIHSDEIATWKKDMNKYSNGGDQQAYTSLFDGGGISITRKTSDPLRLKETFVSICGSIQTTVVPELFNNGMIQSGFTDRFLFQFPTDLKIKHINGERIDPLLWNKYDDGIRKLLEIDYDADHPMYLRMEGDGLKMFNDWYNQMVDTLNGFTENNPNRGIYAKMLTMFARFPLLIHGTRVAFEDKGEMIKIDERDVQGAIELTKYFLRNNIKANDIMTNSCILDSLPEDKLKFYELLPDGRFVRKDAVKLALEIGLSEKAADRFIRDKTFFRKVSWGEYEKTI